MFSDSQLDFYTISFDHHSKGLCDQNMPLATKLGLMLPHHKPGCLLEKKKDNYIQVKVTVKGQNVNVCLGDIFQTAKHFVTKLGIVMHYHELEYMQKSVLLFSRLVTARAHMIRTWQFLLSALM